MYSNDMDKENTTTKTSIKWMEVPIQKFNTAVPHFADLLKTHKNNIIKLKRLEQWGEVQKENAVASRQARQLTNLVAEMDNLRLQVVDSDLVKFDKMISGSKQQALTALRIFKEMNVEVRPLRNTFHEDPTTDNTASGVQAQLQVVADITEDIEKQERLAASMERVQEDIQDINSVFQDLSLLVHEQGEAVQKIEENVEEAHHNVVEGERMLCQAAKYKNGMYPLVGALVGTVLGGPIGLVAGAKLGSLTAVGCGLIGFTGGKFLKNQTEVTITEANLHRENVTT